MALEYLLGSDGPTALDITRQAVSRNSDGAVVAAVAGRKICVLAMHVTSAANSTVKFQSNTTDLTGAIGVGPTNPINWCQGDTAWLKTAAGEALNVDLSGTDLLSGLIVYYLD
jgi:hypothetical protein